MERVATVYGVEVSNMMWKDNKTVMLLSTLTVQQPMEEVVGMTGKQNRENVILLPTHKTVQQAHGRY